MHDIFLLREVIYRDIRLEYDTSNLIKIRKKLHLHFLKYRFIINSAIAH